MSNSKINRKLLMTHIPLTASVLCLSLYALININILNNINNNIVEKDTILISAISRLAYNLHSQESFRHNNLSTKNYQKVNYLLRQNKEFGKEISIIQNKLHNEDSINFNLSKISLLHRQLNKLYNDLWENHNIGNSVSNDKNVKEIEIKLKKILNLIKKIDLDTKVQQGTKVETSQELSKLTIRITIAVLCIGIFFGAISTFIITNDIMRKIKHMKVAISEFSKGNFEFNFDALNHDELGELLSEFAVMGEKLSYIKKNSLDSNPLTYLPSGNSIENILRNRLETGESIAFCILDLDYFKSYNDKYGYSRGNQVIIETAEIIKKAVSDHNNPTDLVGHIGGDDFVILTTPERFNTICHRVIRDFDKMIVDFYDREDISKGYIITKSRQGKKRKFPLMTISIAAVVNTENKYMNHVEVSEIAAELKGYAKSIPGSVVICDRRKDDRRYFLNYLQKRIKTFQEESDTV